MFQGKFWTNGRTNIAGISRFGNVAWCPGLYRFHACALCHEVPHRELFANIPSLLSLLLTVFFQSSPKIHDMITGEDANKDRFKDWKLCPLWKLPFHNHGAIKLMQNCVCFPNLCITRIEPAYGIFVLWFRPKNSNFRLPYQRPSSSADCARELFNGSNGSASLVDCNRKKIFCLVGAGFLWVTS